MMETQKSIDKIRDRQLQLAFESERINKEVIEGMHKMKQFYERDRKHIQSNLSKETNAQNCVNYMSLFPGLNYLIATYKQ